MGGVAADFFIVIGSGFLLTAINGLVSRPEHSRGQAS
jgi:hypothetical protein